MSLTKEIGSWIASPFASKLIDRASSCMSAEGHKAQVLLKLRSLNSELELASYLLSAISRDEYESGKRLASEKWLMKLKGAAEMAQALTDKIGGDYPGTRRSWSLFREIDYGRISIDDVNEALNRLREAMYAAKGPVVHLGRAIEVEDYLTPLLRKRLGDIRIRLDEIKIEIDEDLMKKKKKKRPRESLEDLLGDIQVNIKNVMEQIDRLLGPLSSTSTSTSTSTTIQTHNNLLEVPSLSPSKPIP